MKIGSPKEIKNQEFRVGLTPAGVQELVGKGHEVFIETNAGLKIGYDDAQYVDAGAKIVATPDDVFEAADLIVKVKEPQPVEIAKLQPKHTLFTYLHLAPDPEQSRGLMKSGATCIAYETVTDRAGRLPLLVPMSEVAGRLATQVGAQLLQINYGGPGVLLGGVTGTPSAKVTVIGGGISGTNAALMAIGLGADVTVLDRSTDRLRELHTILGAHAKLLYSTQAAVSEAVAESDLVIGAVLVPGAAAPRVVSKADIAAMKPGSAVVDIAIDQGGCFETSKPTSHAEPTFIVDGVTHYCVTNMPALAARTATQALSNVTLPFVHQLADLGADAAMAANPHLAAGLNVQGGKLTHPEVIKSLGFSE
ncbi:alanine dehydrogenase [Ponticaulis sp.]|uniref:alanine dehydrogenase n=1 Tax=Ponticaulis sp. TaxID=2020902 RepID=UPI000B6B656F|nr:alanine dehydrogenase [Ponticaulis sp.]MAI90053.1 alanine dehydrogenase [Ponticaulis sp.]OUX99709.1 MAG: alanine dehydrogenase [Hyphomonadaceae bacterium TMED5]|tara:strand:- start:5265 stop:6356 length:1092 start_codon:yes stop_codon:yes gene_type:complete